MVGSPGRTLRDGQSCIAGKRNDIFHTVICKRNDIFHTVVCKRNDKRFITNLSEFYFIDV